MIAIDLETYDPELTDYGSGVYRKDGYILGFSYMRDTGEKGYLNLGHKGITESERKINLDMIRRIVSTEEEKVGANILYDIDWLQNWAGIKVGGKWHDVQIAEPLLDEYKFSYALEVLGQEYLKEGKVTSKVENYCKSQGWTGDFRQHLWKCTYEMVKDYALGDVDLPLRILPLQLELLDQQDLLRVYDLEISLLPLLLQMRKSGARISENNKNLSLKQLNIEEAALEKKLFDEFGYFNINSSAQIGVLFDRWGIPYPRTAKTNAASITKDYLEGIADAYPVATDLVRLRGVHKVKKDFILGTFSQHVVEGRVHSNFLSMKRDEGGTVTGRFSCQNPNLQQIPARDEEFALLCRRCVVGEEGQWYGKIDYSQIEYRIIVNYAIGPKSDFIRRQFNQNPKTDYHKLVMEWTGLDRKPAKNLNFGIAYCMGIKRMAAKYHWNLEYCEGLYEIYYAAMPFIKPTRNYVINTAKAKGFIRTVLGRRARVSDFIRQEKKEYVMFNRLIQGSAADVMKKGMSDAYKVGIFEVLTPHITVHDEMGVSIPKTKIGIEAYSELKRTMENCVKLNIPILAEAEYGPSWGETEEFTPEKALQEI